MSDEPKKVAISGAAFRYTSMGDHAEYVGRVIEIDPNETVGELMERWLAPRSRYERVDWGDRIVLQYVEPREGHSGDQPW